VVLADGAAAGFGGLLIVQFAFIGLLIVAALYAILAMTAALGLTSFSVFERFRKKRPEESDDGGIDDLF
jgi:hypothetical protein